MKPCREAAASALLGSPGSGGARFLLLLDEAEPAFFLRFPGIFPASRLQPGGWQLQRAFLSLIALSDGRADTTSCAGPWRSDTAIS